MSTCHHVNEPPEISNKGTIKKDKSELFVWAPDLAGNSLPPHLFPTIFRVSCSVLTVVTRWRHPQVPIRG